MPRPPSTVLPIAYAVLRLLTVLNWIYGAIILAILVGSVTNQQWTFTAIGFAPSTQARALVMGVRAIAALGLLTVPLNLAMLTRLLTMVKTVRAGDPFIAANAYRMNAIAWVLLSLQLISIAIGIIGEAISTPARPLHLDAGFSHSGWLAVILTFVLARVFAEGALMREDLDGTV